MSENTNLYIVGLGASAGGFEALQKLIKNIKHSNDEIAYVITQHLDPKQPTLLGDLLSRHTDLDLEVIIDGMQPFPDVIYFCPPNKDLILKDGVFHLTEPKVKRISPKPSIDRFFESLAAEKKDKAIGIILSGTGSDGAKGISAIKLNGGIALAEDEGAKYFSMPKAAIDTGHVDAVLPPELLGEGIQYLIVDRHYFDKHFEVQDSIHRIFDLLNKKTDIDFSSYKESTIFRRITKRVNETHCDGVDDYIRLLQKDSGEVERLKDELLIIVTSLFRDRNAFLVLKKHLADLIQKKEDSSIRIWVPGCATGEEAFTLAIITSEILKDMDERIKVTIFATDVSEGAVSAARNRTFVHEDLATIDKRFIDQYFDLKNSIYRPKKIIRDMILFSRHDIVKNPPFSNLDLISCRNLLIYFDSELQKRIISIFYYALNYKALLFLGQSESIGSRGLSQFSIVSNKHKVYIKSNDLSNVDLDSLSYKHNRSYFRPANNKSIETGKLAEIDIVINKSVSDKYGKNGLVVDGNTHAILYFKGDCSAFLAHPKGLNSNDLFKQAADYLRLDLRATLIDAIKNCRYSASKKIRVMPITDQRIYTTISVFPLETNKLGDKTFFITFDTLEIKDKDLPAVKPNKAPPVERFEPIQSSEVNVMEDELINLKEKLQITIEELETSNEELQSTNEELQSTNEELQSTNEELETSNEELHSTNEELETVNDELTLKNLELEFANNAFNSVLDTIETYVLVVDSKLNIIKYSNGITLFFDFDSTTTNLSALLLNARIELPDLMSDIKACLHQDKEIAYEVVFEDRTYWFNIKRIKVTQNLYDDDQGLVISFIDKTDIVRKDRLLFQQSKMAAMGEMIGNIAHQWKQPLNALGALKMGVVSKYQDNKLDDAFIERFDSKSSQLIEKMADTIEDFRNFFRPEKAAKDFNVSDVIVESLAFVEDSYKNHAIDIKFEPVDIILSGYKNELVQVMLNLLNNSKEAIMLSKQTAGWVKISVQTAAEQVLIYIEDNGGGIDEEILNRVFEPYFTTKFKSDGTGVGLYMSKMIIEQSMNGKLALSNENGGVRVSIHLPLLE